MCRCDTFLTRRISLHLQSHRTIESVGRGEENLDENAQREGVTTDRWKGWPVHFSAKEHVLLLKKKHAVLVLLAEKTKALNKSDSALKKTTKDRDELESALDKLRGELTKAETAKKELKHQVSKEFTKLWRYTSEKLVHQSSMILPSEWSRKWTSMGRARFLLCLQVKSLELVCKQHEEAISQKDAVIREQKSQIDKHSQIAALIHDLSSGKNPNVQKWPFERECLPDSVSCGLVPSKGGCACGLGTVLPLDDCDSVLPNVGNQTLFGSFTWNCCRRNGEGITDCCWKRWNCADTWVSFRTSQNFLRLSALGGPQCQQSNVVLMTLRFACMRRLPCSIGACFINYALPEGRCKGTSDFPPPQCQVKMHTRNIKHTYTEIDTLIAKWNISPPQQFFFKSGKLFLACGLSHGPTAQF